MTGAGEHLEAETCTQTGHSPRSLSWPEINGGAPITRFKLEENALTDLASPSAARQPSALRRILALYFNPYRLAAYALALYALGHTFGAVVQTPDLGAASDAVVSQMKSVHVSAAGWDTTWYHLYRGLGGLVSVFLVFSMVVCWYAGGRSRRDRLILAPILWALLASQAAGAVIAFAYLFSVPVFFSVLVAVLLGVGCFGDLLTGRHLAPST